MLYICSMKMRTWRTYHKFVGLGISVFLMLFCISGILLNHKSGISNVDVDRSLLPSAYRYHNWNKGSLRGTVDILQNGDSAVIFYGTTGMWQYKWNQQRFFDFNQGLAFGADSHNIRSVVALPGGQLFAINETQLYRLGLHSAWGRMTLPLKGEELSDLTAHDDTLVVVGRSHIFLSVPPYKDFKTITLASPKNYKPRISLFRVLWGLHGGSILGEVGRFLIDLVAFILIFLMISGWIHWLFPKYLAHIKSEGYRKHMALMTMKQNRRLHEFIGRKTIWITLFVAVSGWVLRPPMMIPLTLINVPNILGILHHDNNAWSDKLRMLRYDSEKGDWLLATSEGFYSLPTLHSTPVRIESVPPVSTMGVSVFQRDEYGNWLIGSYSGMYVWNRYENMVIDYFTADRIEPAASFLVSSRAVSGYISAPSSMRAVVEYEAGTDVVKQPEILNTAPVSLRFLAAEIHSGRIYTFFSGATIVCILILGALICWGIWSGWEVRHRKRS